MIEQQIGIAEDRREHVVEVVGNATREPADRFHLVRLPHLGLAADPVPAPFRALARVSDRSLQQLRVGPALHQVVLRPALNRLPRHGVVVRRGEDNQRRDVAGALQGVNRREAIAVRETQVEQDGVEPAIREGEHGRRQRTHPVHAHRH